MKIAALAALAAFVPSFVDAAPLRLDIIQTLGGATFKITQVRNGNMIYGARRGPIALARAYSKYGIAIPPDLQAVIEAILRELGLTLAKPNAGNRGSGGAGGNRGNGTNAGTGPSRGGNAGQVGGNNTAAAPNGEVAAIPAEFDSQYLCPVLIGTPPQQLTLNFDTGSSDLWVFSSETPASQLNGQAVYNVAASSTAQRVEGASWNISYGDGSSSHGNVYLDTVTIGGITVENQAVESATQVSASFTRNTNQDGLVGLAFGQINTVKPNKQATFFENALEQLAMPVFSANLKRDEAGSYTFGFLDNSEFEGDISFIDVNSTRGFWQVGVDGVSIGSATGPASLPHQAIMDTGTTLLLLPDELVQAYYRQVPGAQMNQQAGGYVFSCNSQLPDYTAKFGSYLATVPGDFIKFAPLDSDDLATATVCFGGIQSVGRLPFAIYGDVFLKSQFVVFHGGQNQVGLARKPL